jgi:transposase
MMVPRHLRVFLAVGATDMRKSINGLCLLVQMHMELDPFAGHLFGFCNRRRNLVKLLYWDRNGFCLWQKRLERHRFIWPKSQTQVLSLDGRELNWLLEGVDLRDYRCHETLHFSLAG